MTSKLEALKDVVQVAVESGATRVGRIAGLVTGAVRDVAHEVGEWASDVFEVIEAAKRPEDDQPARRGRHHDDSSK